MASSFAPPAPHHPNPPPGTIAAWRVFLRILGALLVLATFAYWVAAGANTGLYKDKIEIKKTDEVTGIEYVEYQDKFRPGLESLVLGTGLGLALIGLTFFPSKKTKHTS